MIKRNAIILAAVNQIDLLNLHKSIQKDFFV